MLKRIIKYFRNRWIEFVLCLKEFGKGQKFYGEALLSSFKSTMLVKAHSIEKGLGLKNAQSGHSAKQVLDLLNRLDKCIGKNYSADDFFFAESFRVISAYIDFQKKFDTSDFRKFGEIEKKYDLLCEKLGKSYVKNNYLNYRAGAVNFKKTELQIGADFDFDNFVSTRHSIRMFDMKEILLNDLERAVETANKAPSACNRQPCNVFFSSEREVVKKIDSLITGSNGFKGEVPNYIIITVDRAYFHSVEQFQCYINGGIYVSYMTLALHSLGIGSCIMQWKAFYRTEKELKDLMGISSREAVVAVIGCGYYADDTKCICAQRKNVEETLHVVN